KPDTVTISPLTIRQLYKFIHCVSGADTNPELVAMCCGKPVEWVDTLADESFGALSKRCFELNFPRAANLAKTDPIAAATLSPTVLRLQNALKIAGRISGGSLTGKLPPPPPADSSAVTPEKSSTSHPDNSPPSSPPPPETTPAGSLP
ncbi:MAG: hypothetical protein LBR12_04870, partial [Opitutaceae bacterium]|nr:hypothetical protein [Opitutaceae bacterium]